MPLPGSVSTATITEAYLDATGAPDKGTVTLTPTTRVTVAGTSITLGRVVGKVVNGALLGPDGASPLIVAATDDADLSPAGWAYRIEERVGRIDKTYLAFVPAGSIVLHTLAPIEEAPEGEILVRSVNGVGPDETGDVVVPGGAPHTHPIPDVVALQTALDGKEASGAAAALDAAHLAAADPHPQYLTSAEGNSAYSAAGHTHPRVRVVEGRIVTGNVNLNTAGASWGVLAGLATLSIPAVVGDRVWVFPNIARQVNAQLLADIGVVASGVIRRWYGNGFVAAAPTALYEGSLGLYHSNIPTHFSGASFVVTADDLDGGNVAFAVIAKAIGGGSALILADTTNPLIWTARNEGPTD